MLPVSIGVDFDNTLIAYDEALGALAVQRGLIPPPAPKDKKCIRDLVRQQPGGEIEWQKLQARIYGVQIAEARPAEGAEAFFRLCQAARVSVYIVSHKTHFAAYDEDRVNLRAAALRWMTDQRFFELDGWALLPERIYFGATRQEKIDHIRRLGCTHFIDDLEETFLEAGFPLGVEKILYAPHPQAASPPGIKVMKAWQDICDYFFSNRS